MLISANSHNFTFPKEKTGEMCLSLSLLPNNKFTSVRVVMSTFS
ncbi:hypothetical protein C408_1322 [Vibrio diabolicus E0666]|nr:hypothetical protein C408_1322 [Vibrio diabolicus E0666]